MGAFEEPMADDAKRAKVYGIKNRENDPAESTYVPQPFPRRKEKKESQQVKIKKGEPQVSDSPEMKKNGNECAPSTRPEGKLRKRNNKEER